MVSPDRAPRPAATAARLFHGVGEAIDEFCWSNLRPLWNRKARSDVLSYRRAIAFGLASAAESISRRPEMTRTQTSNALSWHYSISLYAVAGSFAMILPPTSSVAQTVQGAPAVYRVEVSPPLDPRTLSCDALKDRLQRLGGVVRQWAARMGGNVLQRAPMRVLGEAVIRLCERERRRVRPWLPLSVETRCR